MRVLNGNKRIHTSMVLDHVLRIKVKRGPRTGALLHGWPRVHAPAHQRCRPGHRQLLPLPAVACSSVRRRAAVCGSPARAGTALARVPLPTPACTTLAPWLPSAALPPRARGHSWPNSVCSSHFITLCMPVQFMKAVEMKQVAEQDAERAKFVVMKAEQVRAAGAARWQPARTARTARAVRRWVGAARARRRPCLRATTCCQEVSLNHKTNHKTRVGAQRRHHPRGGRERGGAAHQRSHAAVGAGVHGPAQD